MYFLISPGRLFLLLAADIIASLLVFIIIIATLVFLLRKPMRQYKPLDLAVFDRLQGWINPRRNRWMLFITFLGKHQFLVPANLLLVFYFLLVARQSWFSIRVATIALSSLALMLVLKTLFGRKRPLSPLLKAARGLSFPSGHAIMSVSFFGMIIYCILHAGWSLPVTIPLVIILIVLILLIGFSRIYLRVHYTSDVVSGFIIGLLWLFISLFVIQRVEAYSISAMQ